MMHRFLALGQVPELRTEPNSPDKGIQEMELLLPVEIYWQMVEVLKELRYLRIAGQSTARQYNSLQRLIAPFIVLERDRLWFAKNGLG